MHTVTPPHSLSGDQLTLLHEPVDRALARSAEVLSEMSGVTIAFTQSTIDMVALADLPTAVGNPGDPAIGVYVGIEGEGSGYVLFLMNFEDDTTPAMAAGQGPNGRPRRSRFYRAARP